MPQAATRTITSPGPTIGVGSSAMERCLYSESNSAFMKDQLTAESPRPSPRAPETCFCQALCAEGRSTAAGALHVRVFKLEARRFKRFHVVDHAAIQIHQRCGVNKDLQIVETEYLIHHPGL